MKDSVVKNILVNLHAGFSINIRKRINDNTNRISALEEFIEKREATASYLYFSVLDYYTKHRQEANTYEKELTYLRQLGRYSNFPYRNDTQLTVNSGFDTEVGLPYVIHEGKRLFFPQTFSTEDAIAKYTDYILTEKLLGTNDAENTPHQYQSPRVKVDEGDTLFDIGAAEGLFALSQVDKAAHIYLVESDPQWIEPLKNTFAPYHDKVSIINKSISIVDTESSITLKKLLSDNNSRSAFVKMDIEGYELPAIMSATDFLAQKEGIKIAAAAYHRQHDAIEMKALFDEMGYRSEFSNGNMLFHLYDTPVPPYFRKGIIRASKV